ncbi:hypothetical protein GCM10027047_13840 [Rhodococcus aerolatus]
MTVTTNVANELIQTTVAKILVQPLEQASTFLQQGPTIFNTSGPLKVPSLTQTAQPVGFVGESASIPFSDVDFGEVSLMPSSMQSIKTILKFSNEMARQSVVALDQVLKQRLVSDVATKLDQQLWSDSTTATQPLGIGGYSGVQTIVKSNATVTLEWLLDMWGLALSANVNTAALKFVMTPNQWLKLRKLVDGQARFQLEPNPSAPGSFTLFGIPVVVTNFLPQQGTTTKTETIYLVDFSQIAVARDLAPSVTVLKETFAQTDEVGLRVVTRYDAKPLNPKAVVKMSGLTA